MTYKGERVFLCPTCEAKPRQQPKYYWSMPTPDQGGFLQAVKEDADNGIVEHVANVDGSFCPTCEGRGWLYQREFIGYHLTK